MKKICLVLMCFLILWTVGACKSNDRKDPDSQTDFMPTSPDLKISVADLSNYKIIYPERSGSTLNNVIKNLTSALSKTLNVTLSVQDDFFNNSIPGLAIHPYEILIGNTNRTESAQFLSDLKYQDYGYAIVENKLVIAGYTEETTVKALSNFITLALKNLDAQSEIFFSNESAYRYQATYPFSDALIEGQSLDRYKIVYPVRNSLSELDAAKMIQSFITENYGYDIKITDDSHSTDGNAIWVGDVSFVTDEMKAQRNRAIGSSSSPQYYIRSAEDGGYLWLSAENSAGILAASANIRKLLTPAAPETSVALSLSNGIADSYGSNIIRSMSFNIYSKDITSERTERVVALIRNYMPDTFGVQEATPAWINVLKQRFGDLYNCVGEGRNGGNNDEYNAVFYRKDKFRLVDSATKWLSSTPDAPASKLEGSSFPRIVTYAILQEIETETIFVHANTHLHHTTGDDSVRLEQSKILINILNKLSSMYPVILTGDFNSVSTSDAYRYIISGGFADSSDIATVSSQKDITSHGYKTTGGRTIDYVFVSESAVIVNTYKVCKDQINGEYPSDHFPVLAEYVLLG